MGDKHMKLHELVTNREFKILLKPKGLDRRSCITKLTDEIISLCKEEKLPFSYLDNATTGLRNIYFYDTPGEDLRLNNIILRVREYRQNVWVDDFCEVTLKCRTNDITQSIKFDPTAKKGLQSRVRLKEEILRNADVGSKREIYSHNAILDTVPLDRLFDRSFGSVSTFFPDLKNIPIDKRAPVRIVGGRTNKILEACMPLGNIVFGNGVQAHIDIAIWMRSVGDPMVGELSFAYKINKLNQSETKAHKRADKFFKKLQFQLVDWLEIGTTKTALIYGKPE
jgi:hypothetical protein